MTVESESRTSQIASVLLRREGILAPYLVYREGIYSRVLKPLVDRVAALLLLTALSPALAAVAALVRVRLGRGVLFRQVRVGRDGRLFTIYKFRTMLPELAPQVDPPIVHKSRDDPRHTPLGRVLRRLSLDELPQLWNVLRGDMSLIGPRPEMVELVDRHNLWRHPRHLVKPGITGMWQVSPARQRPLHENINADLPYVMGVTLRRDLQLIGRTILALVRRSGW